MSTPSDTPKPVDHEAAREWAERFTGAENIETDAWALNVCRAYLASEGTVERLREALTRALDMLEDYAPGSASPVIRRKLRALTKGDSDGDT